MGTVKQKMSPVAFDNAINVFCHYLEIEKRYSPHTVSNYRRDLSEVANDLKLIDIVDWAGANAFNMRGYFASTCQRAFRQKSCAALIGRQITVSTSDQAPAYRSESGCRCASSKRP